MSTTYDDLPYTTYPDVIQTFKTMQDIVAADGANIMLFQQAMQAGDTATASTYYSRITNADNKFISAKDMNTLYQTCIALERYYKNDMFPQIEQKQAEWYATAKQLNYKNTWNQNVAYSKNNYVQYDASTVSGTTDLRLYIAIQDTSAGTKPTNTTYWREITIKGDTGTTGVGLAYMGDWDKTVQYSQYNCVTYNGCLWSAKSSNKNNTPSTTSSYWQLVYRVEYPVIPTTEPENPVSGQLWFEVL